MPLVPSQQQTYFGVQIWDESVTENWLTFGTSSATRTIVCTWTDRVTLINNIMGMGGINAATQYTYNPAASYPDAPATLYISSIQVTGIASYPGFNPSPGQLVVGPNGMVGYPLARLQLKYTSLPYDPNNLNVTSMDYSVEEVTIPNNSYGWVNQSYKTPIDQSIVPSLRVGTLTITIQQFLQPFLPESVVAPILGKSNNASVFGFDQPGQTILAGYKTNRRIPISGMVNYDCTLNFQVLLLPGGAGWNHKLCPEAKAAGGSIWQPIADNHGTGDAPFPQTSFAPLGINNPTGLIP